MHAPENGFPRLRTNVRRIEAQGAQISPQTPAAVIVPDLGEIHVVAHTVTAEDSLSDDLRHALDRIHRDPGVH